MLAVLRRCRVLFWAALVASPGLAGQLLGQLHACPAMTNQAHSASHADAEHHSHGSQPTGPQQECHCIGSCAPAALVLPRWAAPTVSAGVEIVLIVPGRRSGRPAIFQVPLDRLPPATAPPVA